MLTIGVTHQYLLTSDYNLPQIAIEFLDFVVEDGFGLVDGDFSLPDRDIGHAVLTHPSHLTIIYSIW